jgi:hypothetical protein
MPASRPQGRRSRGAPGLAPFWAVTRHAHVVEVELGTAVGELRDDGATEGVTDEHDRLLIRRLQCGLGDGHVVRVRYTAGLSPEGSACPGRVGASTRWPRASSRERTPSQHQPPCQEPCTSR